MNSLTAMVSSGSSTRRQDREEGWMNRVARSLRARAGYRRNLRYVSGAEFGRMLAETGMGVHDLRAAASGAASERGRLLDRMMTYLGLCPDEVAQHAGGALRDLQRVCGDCGATKQCRQTMGQSCVRVSDIAFCPNAYTLERLLKDRGNR